jgi:hypothetical protein
VQRVSPDPFSAGIEQNPLIAPAIMWRNRGPVPYSLLFWAYIRNVEAVMGMLTHPRMVFIAYLSYTPALGYISAQVMMTGFLDFPQFLKAYAQ